MRISASLRWSALWSGATSVPIFLELLQQPQVLTSRAFTGVALVLFALLLGWFPLLRLIFAGGESKLENALGFPLLALLAMGMLQPILGSNSGLHFGLSVALGILLTVALNNEDFRKMLAFMGGLFLFSPVLFLGHPEIRMRWAGNDARPLPTKWKATQGPVVLVVFDALPLASLITADGKLDKARHPNFARFSEDAIWWPRATTVADYTTIAVPAILSGRRPQGKAELSPESYPANLYTYLRNRPIQTTGIASGLCPPEQRGVPGLGHHLPRLFSDAALLYANRTLPETLLTSLPSPDTLIEPGFESRMAGRLARYERFIDGVGENPNELIVLHMLFPHIPFEYYGDGTRYNNEERRWNPERPPDEWLARVDLERHLEQVVLADRLLGRLIDRLKDKGLYEDATIAVLADHGVSFLAQEPRRSVSKKNYPWLLRVPMFLKAPGVESSVDERPVETIDLLPTICASLGAEADPDWVGHSLFDGDWPGRNVKEFTLIRPDKFLPTPDFQGTLELDDTRAEVVDGRIRISDTDIPLPSLQLEAAPRGELVGQSVESLTVLEASNTANLIQPQLFRATGDVLPGLLQAEIDVESPVIVAVELHQHIVATGRTVAQGKAQLLKLLLPKSAFKNGIEEPKLYLVEGDKLLSLNNETTLSLEGDRLTKQGVEIAQREFKGEWRAWRDDEGDLRIDGWCYDEAAKSIPSQVAVFHNGEFMLSGKPGLPVRYLPDESMKKEASDQLGGRTPTAFLFDLPVGAYDSIERANLRVFSISEDGSGELRERPQSDG